LQTYPTERILAKGASHVFASLVMLYGTSAGRTKPMRRHIYLYSVCQLGVLEHFHFHHCNFSLKKLELKALNIATLILRWIWPFLKTKFAELSVFAFGIRTTHSVTCISVNNYSAVATRTILGANANPIFG